MNKENVSWTQIEDFVTDLVNIHKEENFVGVYGLPRGGLVIAVMLSNRLNIPMLLAPCEGCVIVDDIADSGKSLIHYTINDTQFNRYYIATLYVDDRSIVKPNYSKYKKDGKWLVFPWESK